MTPQQLEALILDAVDRALKGSPVEDDRIELKRDWPDPSKARQLAGSANRANGEPLIYIIGVDERARSLYAPTGVDPATWWSQMESRFEGLAPEVERNLVVPRGNGEAVVGILFRTDRAPYLVKVGEGGSNEYDVPIRDNTRTRSARRDELLRMVVSAAAAPAAAVLSADFGAQIYPADESGPESLTVSGSCSLFLEHTAAAPVLLPIHRMVGEIEVQGEIVTFAPYFRDRENGKGEREYGVHIRNDGVVATGPGTFTFNVAAEAPVALAPALRAAGSIRLSVTFPVAGSDRAVKVNATLERDLNDGLASIHERLGAWRHLAN